MGGRGEPPGFSGRFEIYHGTAPVVRAPAAPWPAATLQRLRREVAVRWTGEAALAPLLDRDVWYVVVAVAARPAAGTWPVSPWSLGALLLLLVAGAQSVAAIGRPRQAWRESLGPYGIVAALFGVAVFAEVRGAAGDATDQWLYDTRLLMQEAAARIPEVRSAPASLATLARGAEIVPGDSGPAEAWRRAAGGVSRAVVAGGAPAGGGGGGGGGAPGGRPGRAAPRLARARPRARSRGTAEVRRARAARVVSAALRFLGGCGGSRVAVDVPPRFRVDQSGAGTCGARAGQLARGPQDRAPRGDARVRVDAAGLPTDGLPRGPSGDPPGVPGRCSRRRCECLATLLARDVPAAPARDAVCAGDRNHRRVPGLGARHGADGRWAARRHRCDRIPHLPDRLGAAAIR